MKYPSVCMQTVEDGVVHLRLWERGFTYCGLNVTYGDARLKIPMAAAWLVEDKAPTCLLCAAAEEPLP